MAAEPIDEDNPIEAILLTGFPNPERIGCLTPDVIAGLGQKRIARDDPAWRHIWNCSPCFRDFKAIRDRRLAEVERRYQNEKRFKRNLILVAALACIALWGFFFLPRHRVVDEPVVVSIDLVNAGTLRGSHGPAADQILAHLPRQLDELHITLPRFSRNGRYIVGILKSQSENTAIALGTAAATTKENRADMILVLKLDLSTAEAGRYFLATRLQEEGQESAAYYYPVLIESAAH